MSIGVQWQWIFGIATLASLIIAVVAWVRAERSGRHLAATVTAIGSGLKDLHTLYGGFAQTLESLKATATAPEARTLVDQVQRFALASQSVVTDIGRNIRTAVPDLPDSFTFWTDQAPGTNVPAAAAAFQTLVGQGDRLPEGFTFDVESPKTKKTPPTLGS